MTDTTRESSSQSKSGPSANGGGPSPEADLRSLLDAVLAQPHAKRKAALLNDALFSAAEFVTEGRLRLLFVLEKILDVGEKIGLDEDELDDLTIRFHRAVDAPQPSQNGKEAHHINTIDLAGVAPQATTWLWLHRIPAGELTVIEGRKATGKSTLVSDIAARHIAGVDMPHDSGALPLGNVLALCGEESLSKTVTRRVRRMLKGYGKELQPGQFTVLDSVGEGKNRRRVEIPEDVALIEDEVRKHNAKLLVVDVLDNFLGDRVDTHGNKSIRRALGPLAELAQKLDITIIVIRHLRKGQEGLALDQGMGSVGIAGQARSVLRADHHPDKDGLRVLAVVACNPAPQLAPTIGYELVNDPDDFGPVAGVKWKDIENLTAEDLAAANHSDAREAKSAEEWLNDLFNQRGNEIEAKVVDALLKDEDFSIRTLKRVKKKMGVISEAVRDEKGKVTGWLYKRPEPAKWGPPDDEDPE